MDTARNESRRPNLLRSWTLYLMASAFGLCAAKVSGVTLAWDPNPEPDIAGYVLHYGTNSGLYDNAVAVGNVTTSTVPGLKDGTTYYFSVTALNTSGLESPPSDEVAYTVDGVRPAVSVTYPTPNARITNGVVTLTGHASDNRGIAEVLYQLNGGPFLPATGTNNWSAAAVLTPGSNSLCVKSVDLTGNESLPVQVPLTCVVMGHLSVSVNGSGTISPNLDGQFIEVGKTCTMTALPGAGSAFAGWSGTISGSQAQLAFVMPSNLVLAANFVEGIKPGVTILTPTANSRVTNGTVTFQGRATDNKGVAQVLYQLNGGSFHAASGTTNWSAALALTPGPNVVRVKSVDTSGNESPPVSETITYGVMRAVTMGVAGNGSIAPNLSGQLLEIGRTYTVTAVPGSGFVFTNWTGGIVTNGARLTFAMRSNLVVTANFIDGMRPTVTIAYPSPNARLTNGTVSLQGRATDNKSVAQVLYQLNGGAFRAANGTTNWSAALALTPGPNVVRVKSVDTSGNESLPVSETITYVVLSPVTMGLTGNGSIVPNLNGQLLEIARSYTVVAVPGPGFALTNWTGDIVTNSARLTFAMRSNLVVRAHFIDVMRPTVAIAYPLPNARVTNGTVTLQGRATDNRAVAQVLYQLNGGAFQAANGTTNWSAALALTPGPNAVRVKSVDTSGNESLPVSETITYVVLSPLTLSTAGSGTVAPNLNGKLLEVGQPYQVTAIPGAGNLFSNWIGGVTSASAQLQFKMQSNLVLTAQFVPNPFLSAQGVYRGLFYETNGVLHESSGLLQLTIADHGGYNGSVVCGGVTTPLSGQFDLAGREQQTVTRPGHNALALDLQLEWADGSEQIKGLVGDGFWVAELLGDRAWPHQTTCPAHGHYTLTIPGNPESATGPDGDGYAFVTVDVAGNVGCQGKLADGQSINQTAAVSKNGEWPLYIPLYAGKGSILSWITFTNRGADDLNGLLSWIRPTLPGTHDYPAGFTNETLVSGSLYTPPTTTDRILNFSAGQVVFTGGNQTLPITNYVTLDSFGRVTNLGPHPMAFVINAGNGFFTGSIRFPGSLVAEAFEGVVVESRDAGSGFFSGPSDRGQVRIEAAAP